MDCVKIGVVGCGTISKIYLENLTGLFKGIEVAGVCDRFSQLAETAAKTFGIPNVYDSLESMLDDPEIEIILNLTPPTEHFSVTQAAIRAGKHVYSEKPLGITLEQGSILIEDAKAKGVQICGAPDTFMGAALQTCRKLIDDGFIGTPVGASAFFHSNGVESWHPHPEFYYKKGGGPVLDMGPYYITALVHLLGSVRAVSGFSRVSFPERIITSQPKAGQIIDVEVATHSVSTLQFESGVIGSVIMSFDFKSSELPRIEIYGSAGTLSVPDPNYFGGEIRLYRPENEGFTKMPLLFDYPDNVRGIGITDFAMAIRAGRKPRANGGLIYHVLEVLSAIQSSSDGTPIQVQSRTDRPEPMHKSRVTGYLE